MDIPTHDPNPQRFSGIPRPTRSMGDIFIPPFQHVKPGAVTGRTVSK